MSTTMAPTTQPTEMQLERLINTFTNVSYLLTLLELVSYVDA